MTMLKGWGRRRAIEPTSPSMPDRGLLNSPWNAVLVRVVKGDVAFWTDSVISFHRRDSYSGDLLVTVSTGYPDGEFFDHVLGENRRADDQVVSVDAWTMRLGDRAQAIGYRRTTIPLAVVVSYDDPGNAPSFTLRVDEPQGVREQDVDLLPAYTYGPAEASDD